MHDCRKIDNRLVDLIFDELQADEKLCLLAEVETCARCLGEYRSMTGTLLVFDQAVEASLPGESYWPEHSAARRERLEQITPDATAARTPQREPLWKRIFALRLPVPVPVAAAITLALLASSALALRPSTREVGASTMQPVATTLAAAPPTVIEVPVLRERIITRTVYVVKKVREKNEALPAQPDGTALTANNAGKVSGEGGLFTRANLTDFQPPDELRIRIVKRNNNEN